MLLRQVKYGEECPLGYFKIDVPAGAGCYTKDPVEACLNCNFSDLTLEKFDLEKICQCPSDMNWFKYERLQAEYKKTKKPDEQLTKTGFQDFVRATVKEN